MSLRQINIDLDSKHVLSYATEANLMKRINEDKALYAEHDDRFIVVRTPKGRWTALVRLDMRTGGYVGRYGFVKI
jgi:hypothetical protein